MRSRRLRIAMVAACPLPARRGTPLRIERLAEALSARGHEVELLTYHLAEEPDRFALPVQRVFGRCASGTLPPGPTLAKLALYDPALALLIARRLQARAFDLIHAHHVEGLLAAALGRYGAGQGGAVPLIYDAHTLLAGELPAYGHSVARRGVRAIGRRLDGWLPRLAEHVVAVTDDIAQILAHEHGLEARRISVVPNGVEVERFVAGAEAVTPRPELVVYSGTLAPYQGIDLLLEAFARALAVRPELRLRLMTNASFAPYAGLAERLGVSRALELLPERLDSLPLRLGEAMIAVLPRVDCPGLPQKLLNYMASGRAVVAFAGSAKRVEHEATGLVVKNHDVAGFAAAILRLAGDPGLARRLGRAAQAHVAATASWAIAAERCERVYAGLIGAERSPQTATPREPAIPSLP
jgi:glycosyltransferase involved in cell wall biosynthesis